MNTSEQKNYTFHVQGMHCNACILMTESELMDLPNISHAKSSLSTNTVTVTGNFGDKNPETIAQELSAVLSKRGYSVSVEKKVKVNNFADFTPISRPIHPSGMLLISL